MSRFDTVYLEIQDNTGTAVFELSIGLQTQGEIDKTFLMGPRGQYVSEVYKLLDIDGDIDSANANRRAAFVIDGGAGEWTQTIEFSTGLEDVQWGDGSGGDGPTNVTARDASGSDVKAQTRKDILELWVARARTDSQTEAYIYTGEWATGTYHSEAGAFNQPMPVAIRRLSTTTPDPNDADQVSLDGSLEVLTISLFDSITPSATLSNSNIGTFAESAADNLEELQNE